MSDKGYWKWWRVRKGASLSANLGAVIKMAITYFRGQWAKLGNYSPCLIFYEGHAYMTIEHAYQAQKTLDPRLQRDIRNQPSPAMAKQLARAVKLRPDWETVKVPLMRQLLAEKFAQEPERGILLSTGEEELIEGNWWNDRFWGQCPVGEGENWLGRLLMELRSKLRAPDQPLADQDHLKGPIGNGGKTEGY